MKKIIKNKIPYIFLTLLCFSQAAFSAIVYTYDNRSVAIDSYDGFEGYSRFYTPDTPYGDFNVTAQNSSLGANGFTASGSGYAFSDYGWASTVSTFDINFTLTRESTISLNGLLSGFDEYYGSGDASVTLYNNTGSVIFSERVSATYGETIERFYSFEGILAAGDYQLIAIADPYFEIASSSYSLNAVITPTAVPLPATFWLFVSGLAGLLSLSRKKHG